MILQSHCDPALSVVRLSGVNRPSLLRLSKLDLFHRKLSADLWNVARCDDGECDGSSAGKIEVMR
jgi:hypothetical protein